MSSESFINPNKNCYSMLYMKRQRVIVTTCSGWTSKEVFLSCESNWPGGVWLFEYDGGADSGKTFVPYSAIDHIEVL